MIRFLLLFFCLCVCNIVAILAQELDTTVWVTNGHVYSTVYHKNNVYISGDFDYIGPNTGNGVLVDRFTGLIKAKFPKIVGRISTSISDGKGGWFIAGNFQVPSSSDTFIPFHLIHIKSDFSLDLFWRTIIAGDIKQLAIENNTLYVAGRLFSNDPAKPQFGNILCAVDIKTGDIKWSVNGENLDVMQHRIQADVITLTNDLLYIGGNFTSIDDNSRNYIAAINKVTGKVTSWNPSITPRANGNDNFYHHTINTICIINKTVYIGGSFDGIGNVTRINLGAVDGATGEVSQLDLNFNSISVINTLASKENTLFIGGAFTKIGGHNRNGLAAINVATGQITTWNPDTDVAISGIEKIYIVDNIVYISGDFSKIGNATRRFIGAVDISSGIATSWNPNPSKNVYTISSYNNDVFLGGYFGSVNGQQRFGLAAIDASSGIPTSWQPDTYTFGTPKMMTIWGNRLYVALNNHINQLAAIDINSGLFTNWKPSVQGYINSIVASDTTIYVGGSFTEIEGKSRNNVAALNSITGRPNNWNPDIRGIVNCMAIYDGLIYVGGTFSRIGNQTRNNIGAIDLTTGIASNWQPNANGPVEAIAFHQNTVYIGGRFSLIGGQLRNNLAAFSTLGASTSWNPDIYGYIKTISIVDNKIYIGGDFTSIGGKAIGDLASFDINTGVVTSWRPIHEIGFGGVFSFAFNEKTIYVGGDFNRIGNIDLGGGFAVFGKTISFPSKKRNYINGSIFIDKNKNCKKDSTDNNLENFIITATPGPYYAYTDIYGNYSLEVDTGSFTVRQIIPKTDPLIFKQVCPVDTEKYTINFSDYNNKVNEIDFANEVKICPKLIVDVSSDRRRRCFRNNTKIIYANDGFASAANVKVHVKFPTYVVPVSASNSYTITADSVYIFDIGTLEANQSGVITIMDSVLCGIPSIRGLTQCTKVWITPANTCLPPDSKWDKSDITLQAGCKDNGVVRMAIYNHGQGPMADSSSFRIYADAILVFKHSYKLSAGDSLILQVPANGQTLRLEADQRPYYPKEQTTTITIEACGKDKSGKVSKGFVTQLPVGSETSQVAMECLPITDSYDPNDKLVVPQGTTASHYTPSGKALTYTIRFQNTGTDTAYKVVVVDTLDANLDVSTFRVKAASHPYQLTVSGKGRPVLTFTFNNINLPDSNRNEVLSHGYIKFTITPQSAITQGAVIDNHADILFDYNPAVRTNTVTNTIFDVPQTIPSGKESKVIVCRQAINPSAGENRFVCAQATVVLQGVATDFGTGTWHLLKGSGRIHDAHNPNSLITDLGYGENIFEWRVPANTCTSDSLTSKVSITNIILPLVKVVGSDSICGEVSVKLVANGASGYKWYSNLSATEPISTDSVFTTPVLIQSTTYYVAAVEYGCEGPRVAVQAQIQPLPPTPVITQVSADSLFCSMLASSYEWFLDGMNLNLHTQNIKVEKTGKYTVKTITNSCISLPSEAFSYQALPTGITEDFASFVQVYPNPAPGRFTLRMDIKDNTYATLVCYDTFGKEVYASKLTAIQSIITHVVDLTANGKGMFLLRIQTKERSIVKKVFIQ